MMYKVRADAERERERMARVRTMCMPKVKLRGSNESTQRFPVPRKDLLKRVELRFLLIGSPTTHPTNLGYPWIRRKDWAEDIGFAQGKPLSLVH